MAIIRETKPEAAVREPPRLNRYRSDSELKTREAVERWGRAKWPDARVVHELVMDRGTVRADVAFIGRSHFAVVEIKSDFDNTDRLLQQAGMFRLASPEVWIVCPVRHLRDAELVRYLMPSLGIALTDPDDRNRIEPPDRLAIVERDQPAPFTPIPEATLCLLWVEELFAEASRSRLVQGAKRPTHAKLVELLLKLSPEEQVAAVCRQLRARNAFWRADPPIYEETSTPPDRGQSPA